MSRIRNKCSVLEAEQENTGVRTNASTTVKQEDLDKERAASAKKKQEED